MSQENTENKKKWKNPLSCERLQIAVYSAIAWSFPAGKQPSFRILQLFQQKNQTPQSKASEGNPQDTGGPKDAAMSCVFSVPFPTSHTHTEVLYLWVLYVTV